MSVFTAKVLIFFLTPILQTMVLKMKPHYTCPKHKRIRTNVATKFQLGQHSSRSDATGLQQELHLHSVIQCPSSSHVVKQCFTRVSVLRFVLRYTPSLVLAIWTHFNNHQNLLILYISKRKCISKTRMQCTLIEIKRDITEFCRLIYSMDSRLKFGLNLLRQFGLCAEGRGGGWIRAHVMRLLFGLT